jgi:hypothetical protein
MILEAKTVGKRFYKVAAGRSTAPDAEAEGEACYLTHRLTMLLRV